MSDPELRDLPGLQRFGDDLRAAAVREERGTHRRRLVRRTLAATAVLLAGVPTAVATRSIWSEPIDEVNPGRPAQTSTPVIVDRGSADGVRWVLSIYDSAGGRCVQLRAFAAQETKGGGCNPAVPHERDLDVQLGNNADTGFVFGAVSPAVLRVAVVAPGVPRVAVDTHEPARETLQRSGTTPGFRTYVAVLARPLDPSQPFIVLAYGARGRILDRFSPPTGP